VAVEKLLGYRANPNLLDVNGTSALFEATKNNHKEVAEILLKHGGELSMSESLAATILCQAVYDGNIPMLKRLLHAKIQVNACDYDKRTAAHIAASEGNLVAFKLLVEAGADVSLEDRWGNTVRSEAEKGKSGKVLAYLDSLNEALWKMSVDPSLFF
jgi:ankyrin repeat protein